MHLKKTAGKIWSILHEVNFWEKYLTTFFHPTLQLLKYIEKLTCQEVELYSRCLRTKFIFLFYLAVLQMHHPKELNIEEEISHLQAFSAKMND